MDQLKQFLAQVQKYHFWLLAVLAIVISLTGWFFAKRVLSADYISGREKVKMNFDKTDRVKSIASHPNAKWTDGVKGVTEKLKKRVFEAWNMVYGEQRANVLHWPKALGADFEKEVRRLGPFDTIPERMCENYRNYINKEFVELLKIVHARSFDEKIVPVEDDIVKLQWDFDNQKRIYASLQWVATPTSPQVRNAQENLWVYEALLAVIAKINENADGVHTSKIRAIETLSIGREAAEEFKAGIAGSRVWPYGSTNAANAAKNAAPAMLNPGMRLGAPGGRMLGGNDAASGSVTDEGRYVNEQGKPIEAGAAFPLEFKRMPIYMKLIMDQRELNKLLVELANSPLPVEVRQVRFRSEKSLNGRGPAEGGGGGAERVIKLANDDDKNPYEMTIEIHGIIYIFNPPDNTKLGQPAEGSEQPAEGEKTPAPQAQAATQ